MATKQYCIHISEGIESVGVAGKVAFDEYVSIALRSCT